MKGILRPIYYLETTRKSLGDIFIAEFASFPDQVIISDPEAIQKIFTADAKLFLSGSGNEVIQPLVGTNSLILLDGDRHIQQRKLLMPPFHGERMRAYGQLFRQITQQVMDKLTPGETFIAREKMQEISLQVILRTVFGLQEGERYQQIQTLLTEMLDSFESPISAVFLLLKSLQIDLGSLSPWGKFIRKRAILDKLLYQEIKERRQQNQSLGEDILSLLLSVQDENGQFMSDTELRDELMTMLFAGHETTATAIAWALYWLHYLPEVKEKLLNELHSVDLENIDPMELAKLPYLNAVCSETLRIYPVVFFAFPRILQAPMQLLDYQFPQGTMFSICIYLTHHRSDIYPEPEKFLPERFLEKQFSPYEFLPFGGGNRRCLGMAFASLEMKIVLATILSRYKLTLQESQPLKPVRRGLTFTPAGGVHLALQEKSSL
ncbi:cytochrome P450 [Calothrix sp. 336/3]|nr:cytochrome P450 [Calothrix sp. 336/3]